MIEFFHSLSDRPVLLGILRAEGIDCNHYPAHFDSSLSSLLEERKKNLLPQEEKIRQEVRNMLRIGKYKPTGRGKPASEYLIRTVQEEGAQFPRINSPVDMNNYISLKYLLPISLWDLDLAGSEEFLLRLGKKNETFVFNQSGQSIDIEDLMVVCRKKKDLDEPIANPVKDSLLTKTTPQTRRIGVALYCPQGLDIPLERICQEFGDFLKKCGSQTEVSYKILAPGQKEKI